jgi:hypothetical protein
LAPWSSLMRARDKLPIWSTPTLQVDRPELLLPRSAAELGPGYAAAQLLRWRIIDRNGMVRTLQDALHSAGQHNPLLQWTDRTHFQPYVNIEFNNVLLNMIC